MILYGAYLATNGIGPKISKYMGIICIQDEKGRTMYNALKGFLGNRGFCDQKMIGIWFKRCVSFGSFSSSWKIK